jgi:dihydrofolate reductase
MEPKVFFDVMVSLDGFAVPEGMDLTHADDPEYNQWMKKWAELTKWLFQTRFFRKNLKLGEDGESGEDNQFVEKTFRRTGVSIMGKRMFDLGERMWPEEAPFHTPVFVLTHRVRKPWERPGGTTFYFVNDGIENALSQAKSAAGGKDVRIAGGPQVIQQYLNAGMVDEFTVHYSPVFFGAGAPLFSGMNGKTAVRIRESIPSKEVTHVSYIVQR